MFVIADSVAVPAAQELHAKNDWVWVVCLPFLPQLCPFLYEYEPFIEVSKKNVCPAQQTCVVHLINYLYQALFFLIFF